MRMRIFTVFATLFLPCLAFGQVVIPGTGGATPAVVAGNRTTVVPALCTGTDKMSGILTGGIVQCKVDVSGTTLLTTKGDLLGYSTIADRFPVGTDTQCLIADSAAAFGIKWGSCASGGGHNITVNGVALASGTDADFDDALPAAPANGFNIKWQKDALDPTNISAYFDTTTYATTTVGSGSTIVETWNVGASDPVWTIATGVMNLSTGALQEGGTNVVVESLTLTGGNGIETLGDLSANRTVAVDLNATVDGVGSTSNLSGMEFTATGELALLQGCALNDILKYNTTGDLWECAIDGGGGSSFGTIGTAVADSAADTLTVTDSGRIDFTTTDNPENLTADIVADSVNASHIDETVAYALSSTSNTFVGASYTSGAADPADGGVVRVGNTQDVFCSEIATPGIDLCLLLDASDIWQIDGTFNAATLTEGGTAVPNTGDNLSVFAATTVAQLAGVLSDENFTPGSEVSAEGVLDLPDLQGQLVAGQYGAASIDGDDVNTNLAGSGLVLTAAAPDTLDIDLIDIDDQTGSSSNQSGLEFGGTGGTDLGLLRACTNGQIIKFNTTGGLWECAADAGAGGGDNITVNGATVTDADFDDTDPAAPSEQINVKWQLNTTPAPDSVSAYVPILAVADGVGVIASDSGFEPAGASSDLLALLQGCAEGDILKWDNTATDWECQPDNSGGANVDLLDGSVHQDTAVGTVVRGDIITGQTATPLWTRLALGTGSQFLGNDGTDALWEAVNFTDLAGTASAAQIQEVIALADLTDVASTTGSGTVALLGTGPTITTFLTQDGDAAEAGYLRLQNLAAIQWEAAPAGTDESSLTVDAVEALHFSFLLDGGAARFIVENTFVNVAASTDETAEFDFVFGGVNAARIQVIKEADFTPSTDEDSALAFFTTLDGSLTERARLNAAGEFDVDTGFTITGAATTGRYLRGDGTRFVQSAGAASGTGTCTNQFARVLNDDAAPTCNTVGTSDIAAGAADNTIIRDSAGFSVIGKTATSTGDPADIVAADETVLGRTGAGNLVFAQVATGQIANSAVTSLKLATANKTFDKSIVVIDPTTTEDDKVQWMHGKAVTYTDVDCSTDTGTATIDMDHRVITTPNTIGTDILTGTIVCDTNNQADGGFADATIPANVPVNLSITAVSGTPGTVRIHIRGNVD